MNEPKLRVFNGIFGYSGKPVVVAGDLTLNDGITCIVGPNGAGKTTLLRGLSGVLEPIKGYVEINGINLFGKKSDEIRKHIGFVPENSFPYPDLTVMEYLHYWGELYDATSSRLESSIKAMGLQNIENKSGNSLSMGQKRRVMLARMLLCDPVLLILDEPTANLDPHISLNLINFITKIGKKIPIIYTTHHLREIENIFDTAIFVNRGKIVDKIGRQGNETDLYSLYMKSIPEEVET